MKKAEVNSKNRGLIAVNLFLIAILAVVAVYAWFTSNAVNEVDAYDVQVHSDNSLELSFDGETNWSETLDLTDLMVEDGSQSVLDKMKFVSITGDGNNFYIPSLNQYENYASVNKNVEWSSAIENQDFLKFTVHMRSRDPVKVYLSSDSYASPSAAQYTGTNCENKSTYGDFSKDCIVGALRVSAFDENNNQKFIWITNPEFHLTNMVGSSEFAMDTESTSRKYTDGNGEKDNDFEWNNSFKHKYYAPSNSATERYTLMDYSNPLTLLPNTVSGYPQDTTLLAVLDKNQDSDGYYHSQADFVVWVEGCDTEARRALIDGKFNLSLIFDSFSTEGGDQKSTVPEDIMNGVVDEF